MPPRGAGLSGDVQDGAMHSQLTASPSCREHSSARAAHSEFFLTAFVLKIANSFECKVLVS